MNHAIIACTRYIVNLQKRLIANKVPYTSV